MPSQRTTDFSPSRVPLVPPSQEQPSAAEARRLVRDLFKPRPWIYWTDFLFAILAGHFCWWLTPQLPRLVPFAHPVWKAALVTVSFAAACILYYRAVMFIHELVHLPAKKFRLFRLAWNLLCGIPFLVPSFTYHSHLDHHRPRSYGSEHDGEYLALVPVSPWMLALYFGQGLYVPLLAIVRFLVLVPLGWFSPSLRRWIREHGSSLVMDPSYRRPQPTRRDLWVIRLQEAGCFAWCLAILLAVVLVGNWPYPFLVQSYATGVVLLTMNAIRTAAAHRWSSDGAEMGFLGQMQDSVTIDSGSLLDLIFHPVGLRFHALHHLMPSLPYHNAGTAHRRLLAELPDASAYRATVERSTLASLRAVWRRRSKLRTDSASVGLSVNRAAIAAEVFRSIQSSERRP